MKKDFLPHETRVSPGWNKSFTQVVLIVSSKDVEKGANPVRSAPIGTFVG